MWPQDTPDIALIRGYLAGDASAFDQLYERYRRPLHAYLNRLVPDANADDLFQKTWIKAIDHLHRYEDRQTFLAWLCRIAHNAAMDHFRRARHQAGTALDDDLESPPDPSLSPQGELSAQELKAALELAIQQLPPEQREVLLLRQRGIPFKDIAEIQEASINTVLGRMHYAVNRLRLLLRDHL